MSDPRDTRYWDRQFEDGLPDSRLPINKRDQNTVSRGGKLWDKIFCANCGEKGGLVTSGSPHVFYICTSCSLKMIGAPPGTIEVKPDGINVQVKEIKN